MKKIEVKLRITAMTWLKIEKKLNFLAAVLGFGMESSFVAVGLGFVATVGADLSGVVFGFLGLSALVSERTTRLTRIVVVLELVSDFFVLFFGDFGVEDFLTLGFGAVLEVLTLIISGSADSDVDFSCGFLASSEFSDFLAATSALVSDLLGRRDLVLGGVDDIYFIIAR